MEIISVLNYANHPLAAPRVSADGDLSHIGEGVCFGTFGELLQGALPPNGTDFLVTLPIERYSRAIFTQTYGQNGLTVEPATKQKSLRLAAEIMARFGLPPSGHLQIQSSIPEGKGLASSSADLVATARALTLAYGIVLRCSDLEEMLRAIEPTDGVMYPGCVCFRHRDVHLHEHLGFLPDMEILAIDEGGIIDTVAFNRHDKRYLENELDEFDFLLNATKRAIREGDVASIGRVATRSAELNQRLNPKRHFQIACDVALNVEALGVVTSHSGTYIGILFASNDVGLDAKMRSAAAQLRPFVPDIDHFSTWKGSLPTPRSALNWRTNPI